ncbi:Flp family type IVb pilin [Allopontixanthobacter sediminis]|uniref:Flp family type IVb pilin n=1 Tax=Allopontixanthobacter sediminis TaxID=1689985 RepID=A0A845AZZ7_9SPHN|nr:Flp family type IVb pilin [Allopontixanthobacter sediminis]MXP43825.1 Flp family type IVb pilin [Allopontixanthobacter sediminis]
MKLGQFLNKLECDASGATAVEYGLILALVFLAMLGAIQGFGDVTIAMWNDISSKMIEASA